MMAGVGDSEIKMAVTQSTLFHKFALPLNVWREKKHVVTPKLRLVVKHVEQKILAPNVGCSLGLKVGGGAVSG